MSDLPEDEAVSSTFPFPFHLFKAKEGAVVSLKLLDLLPLDAMRHPAQAAWAFRYITLIW